MDDWLARARDALAAASGLTPDELELDPATEDILLKLARIAAHDSEARTNAPLLCYLVGVAKRGGRASVAELDDAIRRAL